MWGFISLGRVKSALDGMSLRLFRYFDRIFEAFGRPWDPRPLRTPTLIPSQVLARCDYFRSFPHNVTFASHLPEDTETVEAFRARHQNRDELDEKTLDDLVTPEACLSPAVCYHVYHLNQDRETPASGLAYGVCGKCFRYESSNMSDLRRLWDFTMREIVFLGQREDVLQRREQSLAMMGHFLNEHRLAGEIRTASDPFFVAPDALGKTYFQLSSETKYEVSLMLPGDARLAVGSHNYHSDFFGRAFDTTVEGPDPCTAYASLLVWSDGSMPFWPSTVTTRSTGRTLYVKPQRFATEGSRYPNQRLTMKLMDALGIVRQAQSEDAQRLDVCLACGFMPERFRIFLAAHLRKHFPGSARDA